MASLNKVLLIGNLTKDPELRYTPNGTAVTNLRLAVNRKFKDRTGELKEDTCFITVTAWDKQAEICNQYLQKGRAVFVEGILQSRSWETSDKQKRSTIDVRAERIQFLSGAPKPAEGAAAPPIGGANPAIGGAKDTNEQDEVISPEDIAWEE
ncbi:MAG TPA: single-stranded DNA-binding protein [Candidatus Omnitrophota bacterium]|nr:single-stranded DNA-binding protein [Candidatus Omnitrophota bacterium]